MKNSISDKFRGIGKRDNINYGGNAVFKGRKK